MKLSFRQKLQVIKAYKESGGKDPLYSVLSKFENGGDLPEKSPTIVDNKLEDDNLVGMMKARMAMASQFGNTSAQRMTSVSPKTYQFTGNEQINGEYIGVPKGEVGTHFMSSMDNYAVPFIQERDGNMQFISNPSYKDSEAIKFDRPYDAEYFAEHYKDVAPMMQSFATGGELPEDPPVTNLSNYIRDTSSSNDNTNYKSVPLRKGEPPIIGGTLPTIEIKASNTPKNYRNDPISRREDIKTVPITKSNMHNYPVSVQTEFMKQQVADRPDYEAIRDFENFAATGFGLAPIGILDDVVKGAVWAGGKYLPRVINKAGDVLEPIGSRIAPNAYKINPWAFKPSSDNLYRGLGESGVKDAFESGVLRPRPVELRDIGKDIVTDSGKTFRLKGKTFDKTYYSPEFKIADRYGNGYIAEVPKNSATFNNRYSAGKDWSMHTTEQIPIDKANILKKDWLMGYKKINAPKKQFQSEIDWGKWNPNTPKYPELINEYNTIEESTKKAGTWMKNPDGSAFQGTPEQFIQQQSSWFKKSFGNILKDSKGNTLIVNHGSPEKFTRFDQNKFGSTTDMGDKGVGTYVTPLEYSKNYGNNQYNLYVNARSPLNASSFIDHSIPSSARAHLADSELRYFHRNISEKMKARGAKQYLDRDILIGDEFYPGINEKAFEMVIPFSNRMKSAVGNIGFFDMTNPNIYKSVIPALGTSYIGNKFIKNNNND